MSIGERIASLRKLRNLSQGQLASLMNVSRQAVSKWENDLSFPDTNKLILLADVLNTDVEYLATGNHAVLPSPSPEHKEVQPIENQNPSSYEPIIHRVVEYRTVEKVIEKPVIRRVYRTKYLRSKTEYALLGLGCFLLGLVLGLLI